ncbi:arylsulfate sulfotransferase [Lactobacillus selangorensis]|uniref:Arylsulfate sulfotransferase n=1 Tax=Lactobacillus selangorensis TaxID=81857 RepID=A0A0R2FR68_9LACO|nr:aryl-sulfate sulfotransferase [Lactobacillus selangorensis]KRN28869.1 arylsulfate sulfotransferase [Lactobacillus selangorensis]KRN32721.1 arylsulfate sulfotransferase [Lactobacillus selangorensis]
MLVGWGGYQGYQTWQTAQIEKKLGVLNTKQIKQNITSKFRTTLQKKQAPLVKKYAAIAKDSRYTFAHMYTKVNPYKRSPLSALAIFRTKKATKITIKVLGKTNKTAITTTYKKYQKDHQIAILGLYADDDNQVQVTATAKDGSKQMTTLHLHTAALPKDLSDINIDVKKADKSRMEIGTDKLAFIVRTTKKPFAVDADGAIRWYSTDYSQHVFKQLSNGHILRLAKKNNSADVYNEMLEEDYLGRVYKDYHFNTEAVDKNLTTDAEYTLIHHDAIELPNHNILATVSDGTANLKSRKNSQNRYVEDTLVEISHQTGKIVRVIDFKKLLPSEMYSANTMPKHSGAKDWIHINSLYYQKKTGDLVVSGRHQDIVMKLNYRTLKFVWIYCGKPQADWPHQYRRYLLTPTKGTNFTGGQHAAILIPGTTANTDKLLLFNNNVSLANGDKKTSKKYSQGVAYSINNRKKTITQTWQYGQSLGVKNFSLVIGSDRYLANQNRLLDFGYLKNGTESNIREVTKNGQLVYNLYLSNFGDGGYVYRSERFSLYPKNDGHKADTYE